MKAKNYISFILISCIITQSIIPATIAPATPTNLDSYFTKLKRGIQCYWQKKPCKKEDIEAVQKTAVMLLIILLSASALKFKFHVQWTKKRDVLTKQFIENVKNTQDLNSLKQTVETAKKDGISLPVEYALAEILSKIAATQLSQDSWFNTRESSKKLAHHPEMLEMVSEITGGRYATHEQLQDRFQRLLDRKSNLIAIVQYLIHQGFNPDTPFEFNQTGVHSGSNWSLRQHINKLIKENDPDIFIGYLPKDLVHNLGLGHLYDK